MIKILRSKVLVGAFVIALAIFLDVSPALAVTGVFTASQTVANVPGVTIPAVTFAGGVDGVNGIVPAITFAGGVDTVTSSLPATVVFSGGVDTVPAVPATATLVVPAALAANATDHSVTIDGVTIDLGLTAKTAAQVAAAIAANPFSGKNYTVTNVPGSPAVNFTWTPAGAGGNQTLNNSDTSYTTVNAAAATGTLIVPSALAANATDHSVMIDGVVIDLGTLAQTSVQVATTIATHSFAAGTSFLANGAYTASNLGGTSATITFTRTTAGTAGNVNLIIADSAYTTINGVAATASTTVPASLDVGAANNTINIDGQIINLGALAQTAIQVASKIASTLNATVAPGDGYTVDNVGGTSATLTFTRTATGTAGNGILAMSDATYTTTNEVKASRTINVNAVPANAVNLTIGTCVISFSTANVTDVNCGDNTGAINTSASIDGTAAKIAIRLRSLTGVSATGHGALSVGGSVNDVTFTTTGTETSATPITFSLSAGATITSTSSITGVVPVISTIPAITFTGGVDTVTSSLVPQVTFAGGTDVVTSNLPASVVFSGGADTVPAIAATAALIVPAALAANATDHSVTIDGVTIDLGLTAKTAAQVAAAIAANPFTGKAYTVTNVAGSPAVNFTSTTPGTAGNVSLSNTDTLYTTVNGVAASTTITIASPLPANATDHSVMIDGVTIDLGTAALSATGVAGAVAANPFSGKTYTVTNPVGTASVVFTMNTPGTAGNVSLTIQDSTYTSVNSGAATAIVTMPAGLVANAGDHIVIIDGVTIDLGTSALSAAQVAAAIAANPFTGKNYTVTSLGAQLTFTKNVVGVAGNTTLTLQDAGFGGTAEVVTFTPSQVTAGETFRATINAANYDYTAVSGDTVATVVLALTPLMNADPAVDCVNSASAFVACTATVSGTPFTFAAQVLILSQAPPAVALNTGGGRGGGRRFVAPTVIPNFGNFGSGGPIAGCGNSTFGFSTVSGQSCANNLVFSVGFGNTGSPVTGVTYGFGNLTLRSGSKGAAVMELQRFLNRVQSVVLVVDGQFGPKTGAVVKKWQGDNSLVADGFVGPKTKTAMNGWAATH